MRYAHLADCHIGSWREPLLKDLAIEAFEIAVDSIIKERLDFVLIAGDLFNTSFPPIEHLRRTVQKVKQLKDNGISVYIIPGSHDYSPSGKTMLDILEAAGLLTNVSRGEIVNERLKLKFTQDKKTGAKLTGILGKMGSLEKSYFEEMERAHLESEPGYKIFLFHALLTELKPGKLSDVQSYALSLLPKNFNYYAGGHPHFVFSEKIQGYGRVAYPGPLFPNSFSELEELGNGGFFIIENDSVRRMEVKLHDVHSISIDCAHMSAEKAREKVIAEVRGKSFANSIVTLRLFGTLDSGKPSDIQLNDIIEAIRANGAHAVLKNISGLASMEFTEIKISKSEPKQVEEGLINEYVSGNELKGISSRELARKLIDVLDTERQEGETVYNFERRIKEEVDRVLK
ncbi:DNA repair exonuclease [Candidatus Woesearchaeota archaeon]|nr:DNA repair exonuclease [Candidatus Woesearchaeota archaeon]